MHMQFAPPQIFSICGWLGGRCGTLGWGGRAVLTYPPVLTTLEMFSECVEAQWRATPLLCLLGAYSLGMAVPQSPACPTVQASSRVAAAGCSGPQGRQKSGDLVCLEISLFYLCTWWMVWLNIKFRAEVALLQTLSPSPVVVQKLLCVPGLGKGPGPYHPLHYLELRELSLKCQGSETYSVWVF